jgi:C4-dicarboxylate transporter DctM subunit
MDAARLGVTLLIGLTGAQILLEDTLGWLDRALARVEGAFVTVALALMTLLVFNEYLARELRAEVGDLFGLFALEGQSNVAVLLMVLVGFVGASLATREHQHLTVDALERLSPPAGARLLRRLTRLCSAALCFVLARASYQSVFSHSQDAFEGVTVWRPLAPLVNLIVSLLPGEKYGPASCKALDAAARARQGCPAAQFPTADAWIDAKYDAGLDPFSLYAFGYVDAGDRFPLWLPLAFLAVAFAVMGVRFLGEVLAPPSPPRIPGQKTVRSAPAVALLATVLLVAFGAWKGEGWLVGLGAIALVFLGAPLFVGGGAGTVGAWLLLRDQSAQVVVSDMFEATKKIELLSIPFFVIAGNLMTKGAIAGRLVAVARALVGGLPGGLGAAAVAACAFFAAISGSSPVTVIAIGSVMFPMLIREGYSERYSMGVLTAAGGLGIIIPPSIPMIVYAIMVSGNPAVGVIDPSVLFKAGFGPGILISLALVLYTVAVHWKGVPRLTRPLPAVMSDWAEDVGRALWRGLPSLMLPLLILGGIYNWLSIGPLDLRFSVTEAAAAAVIYALFVELFVHRELSWRQLPSVFTESAVQMGTLFLILVIAISLNRFFVFEQLPEQATAWMVARVDSKWQFILLANLFLLVLGCLMDILSAILIVAPLLAPVAASYGIHPIHFAIMFIVNLEVGYLTPPMGINLFVASTVFDRPLLEVIRAVLQFLVVMLVCLALVAALPWISLVLVE